MRTSSDPAVSAVVAPVQKAAAGASHLGLGTLAPPAHRAHGVLKPANEGGVKVTAGRLVFRAVTVDAWRDLQLDIGHGQADLLDTKQSVAIADGIAGRSGDELVAKCSKLTPTSDVRQTI